MTTTMTISCLWTMRTRIKILNPGMTKWMMMSIQPLTMTMMTTFRSQALRARKPAKKESKQKHSTQRRIDKSNKKDNITDIDDETLSLFQRIVGDNFEVKASQEFEEESTDKTGQMH